MTHTLTVEAQSCRYCTGAFVQRRQDQVFCSNKCRSSYHMLARTRGGSIYDKLIAWRITRGSKKGSLADIAHEIDQWISEDRELGRPIAAENDLL